MTTLEILAATLWMQGTCVEMLAVSCGTATDVAHDVLSEMSCTTSWLVR